MTNAAVWTPVLAGSDAERAEQIVDEIAQSLGADTPPTPLDNAAGFTDGFPGWAVFFDILDRARPGCGHDETVRYLLDAGVNESEHVASSQALFGGITGLAWALQHVASAEYGEALDDLDLAMRAGLDGEPFATEFDLMSGLVGLGVYALERSPAPIARETLERLVAWLDVTAECTVRGISWRARPLGLHPKSLAEFPDGCHYPGVAHGTSGVIGLLASLASLGVAPETTRRLLDGAIQWVTAQELPGDLALFPHQVDTDNRRPPSRSAWCTGGPGISLMMWRAGAATGEKAWQQRAVVMARAAASRPLAEAGVKDACLCHGAAGLGLVYARWFNATGDDFFRDESARWFRRAFEYRQPGEGVAGFAAMNGPQRRRDGHPGLLFGAAGVGLALLAATTTVEPTWDRVFLMSERRA